jgi:hypothetical protein
MRGSERLAVRLGIDTDETQWRFAVDSTQGFACIFLLFD